MLTIHADYAYGFDVWAHVQITALLTPNQIAHPSTAIDRLSRVNRVDPPHPPTAAPPMIR